MSPGINLVDPAVYCHGGPPLEQFSWLRANSPVFFHERGGEAGWPSFWAVTRHEDIEHVSRHPGLFSSYSRLALFEEMPEPMIARHRLMMVNMDPPGHTRQRRLVSRGFTPRMTALLEDQIREVCTHLIDEVAADGEADFVRAVSAPLPLHMLCRLLGAPPEDYDRLLDLSNRLVGFPDPGAATDDAPETAATEYFLYAEELARRRENAPRDDIVTRLIAPDDQGQALDLDEFDMFMMMMAIAGTETTRNAAAGGMLAFLEHPDQWQRLLADPGLGPTMAEEIVRWVSPVNLFRRTATRDTELGGQHIAEGDKVVVFYASGNRDEGVFDRPLEFDIGRHPNPHLGFGGGGPHFCLGKHLAVLELRILFETIAQRLPDIKADGAPRRLHSYFNNGVEELRVRFTPAARL